MLSRLSIKAKLITLVAVLLLALTAIGTFAVIEMRNSEGDSRFVCDRGASV